MTRSSRLRRLSFVPALLAASALMPAGLAQYTSYDATTDLGIDDVAITPDGRYAVVRDTRIENETTVIDLATGTVVFAARCALTADCTFPQESCSGPCNDAVEVTNERAITLGLQVKVIDLTTSPPTEITEIDCGIRPRDVAITDDGVFAIVRGGTGTRGGTYVVELANGAVRLFHPSTNRRFSAQLGNDLADASQFHGVTLAYDEGNVETEILVVEFDPAGGGGPQIVLDTELINAGLGGSPMDVAITPDGTHAVVRSTDEVALVRLDGVNSSVVRTFNAYPGGTLPFGEAAMDTVVCTDTLWATITIADGITSDGYLNVQDIQTGQNWFAFLDGTPRDLVLTPDSNSLLVHTGQKVYRFDLANLPAGAGLNNQVFRPFPATAAGILAGIDSIECTNEYAIAMAPVSGDSRVRIYDLTQGPLPTGVFSTLLASGPIDVEITDDNAYAIAVTQESYLVIDLRTLEERIRVERTFTGPGFPWSDGAAIHPKHAAAFGIEQVIFEGWIDTIDLVSREDTYCQSLANSTGEIADLFALGSTRIDENDLELHVQNLPPNAAGLFFLASGTNTIPLGGGILCLGGSIIRLPVVVASADGAVDYPVDLTNLGPAGSGVVVGSTWNAQLAHRDIPAFGGFNYSNASSLLFE